jgi:hypothetical protein
LSWAKNNKLSEELAVSLYETTLEGRTGERQQKLICLLSLFHVVTPPLLLWAIWRLGYDRRGWLYQTLTAWVVVPVNYFWRPQFDVNWARGLFFHEQHTVPGLLYLLGYLVVVPLLVYLPTHLVLQWWARRGGFLLAGVSATSMTSNQFGEY